MNEYVIDASAVLALALDEPGADRVEELRERCVLSTVNLTEAFSKLVRHGAEAELMQGFLRQAFPHVLAFDREQAETAAAIHAATRDLGLSLGDCACLALGTVRRVSVLTADRDWKRLDLAVNVELIR